MPVEGGLFSADSLARNNVDFFGKDLPKGRHDAMLTCPKKVDSGSDSAFVSALV